ncbi:TonB-dependent receptor [Sulfurimonas gotlandica GD1]|uniref:TonB-dependent receptor n=2 Tax=Sulfurimonas TaxID=202746 RepID=B6BJP5_SULGG|nr:TonB-dependent receptor plug domain-containing protein [Sulfurimonas gotlandica]EDZ62544.1 TonB-dependent receptor domain protein [Sulfurimonas gotlandica GD1]EHP31291.1 TonB-dependent receptor [Sulfurimonas gotlandica GD1]
MLDSISSEMAHYSKVATATKQNEHYQPYIISVFKGKELEKLGVSNLREALALVPGVDMATDNFNNQTPVFRGSNPLAYGQSKLFIDDVLVNSVFFDAYFEYLSFPIEMIKRIEVTRGPGSKTDGVNAYAGSIHVVTYAEDFKDFENNDKLVFKYGSYDYMMGGFVKNFKSEDLKVFTDFYYQQDDKKLYAGPDGLSQGALGAVNIPRSQTGDAPVWLKEYSLGLNIQYKDFSIKARLHEHTQGSAYGVNLSLPQHDDRVKLPNYYLELGYNKEIKDYAVDIKAGIKYNAFDSKAKLAPDNTILSGPTLFSQGVYSEHFAGQRELYQSSYLKYKGLSKHLISAGYRFTNDETIDMSSKLSNRTTGDPALFDYTDTLPFFDKNAKRNTIIVSLQDEFQYSNSLSFIYGFNYEENTYKTAGLEPRVSMVYQHNSNNIFKAIYSRSHRDASWQEMYTMNNLARVGNKNLDPEKVDAFELAYIKKLSTDSYLQSNAFYLINKDQIYNTASDPTYRNVVDTDIYGFELEYKGNLSSSDQVYINYSYVSGTSYIKDEDKSSSLPNVANHLAKGYYIYNFTSSLSLSGIAKYVGAKERVDGDTRDKVEAYSTLDSALSYRNKKYDYTLALSLKNIFDATVKFPSPPKTYSEDYEQEGRNFLIALTKKF